MSTLSNFYLIIAGHKLSGYFSAGLIIRGEKQLTTKNHSLLINYLGGSGHLSDPDPLTKNYDSIFQTLSTPGIPCLRINSHKIASKPQVRILLSDFPEYEAIKANKTNTLINKTDVLY